MVYMTIRANAKGMFLYVQHLLPVTTNRAKQVLQKETVPVKATGFIASVRKHIRQ